MDVGILQKLKDEIRLSHFKNQFIESIKNCNSLLKASDDNEMLWFAYYMKALNYKKIKEIENAIKCAVKAIHVIDDISDNVLNHKYANTLWLLATIQEENKAINKAITICKICSNYYRKVNDNKLRAINTFNMARLRKNTNAMCRIVQIYANSNFKSTTHLHEDMDDMRILTEMLKELKNLDEKKTTYVLYGLENKKLRETLAKNLAA